MGRVEGATVLITGAADPANSFMTGHAWPSMAVPERSDACRLGTRGALVRFRTAYII